MRILTNQDSSAQNVISMLSPEVKAFLEIPLDQLRFNLQCHKEKAELLLTSTQELKSLINEVRASEDFKGKKEMLIDMRADRKDGIRILKDCSEEVDFLEKVISFKTTVVI
jgi:hypothetical protein